MGGGGLKGRNRQGANPPDGGVERGGERGCEEGRGWGREGERGGRSVEG